MFKSDKVENQTEPEIGKGNNVQYIVYYFA